MSTYRYHQPEEPPTMQLGIKLENAMPWVTSQKDLADTLQRLGRAIETYRLNDRNYVLRLRNRETPA
jgi:hypothetical protein